MAASDKSDNNRFFLVRESGITFTFAPPHPRHFSTNGAVMQKEAQAPRFDETEHLAFYDERNFLK